MKKIIKSYEGWDKAADWGIWLYDAVLAKDLPYINLKKNDLITLVYLDFEVQILKFYVTKEDIENNIFVSLKYRYDIDYGFYEHNMTTRCNI